MDFQDTILDGSPPLAVRDYGGSGPALLLLHGVGRTLEDWDLLAPLLRHEHHVVTMDLRGHGRSGDGGWSWAGVLADLERVVQHLGLGHPVVAGHSLGGIIATLYAARQPGCPGAINMDGHTWLPPDRFPGLQPELAQERLEHTKQWMRQQASMLGAPQSEAEFRAALAAQATLAEHLGIPVEALTASITRASVRDAQGLYWLRPSGEALLAIQEVVNATDLFEVYSRVSCPLLIFLLPAPLVSAAPSAPSWLPGFLSAFVRGLTRDLEALAQAQPNVELDYLEAPHIAPLSHPRELARRIHAFLAAPVHQGTPARYPGATVGDG